MLARLMLLPPPVPGGAPADPTAAPAADSDEPPAPAPGERETDDAEDFYDIFVMEDGDEYERDTLPSLCGIIGAMAEQLRSPKKRPVDLSGPRFEGRPL